MGIPTIDERTRLINKRYFLDRGFEQLNQEAFIYRNFLTESECDEIVEEVKSTQEYKDGKPFIYINSIKKYRDRIKGLLDIENPLLSDDVDHVIVRWRGHRDFPHCDVLRHVHDFIENWSWDETDVHTRMMPLHYSAFIMYFNDDFEGGELVYPEYKFTYKPKKGDIVFHNIEIIHAVNEILSDKERISFQGSIAYYRWMDPKVVDGIFKKIEDNGYEGGSNDFFIHQKPIRNPRLLKFAQDNAEFLDDWDPGSQKVFRLEY